MTDAALAPLTSPRLSALKGVKHGFFTRVGGVSAGVYDSLNVGLGSRDDPQHVLENRRRAAEWFTAPADHLLTCYQVHSAVVAIARAAPLEPRPEADGLVTATPGLVCGALSADCAPVLLADPDARVIAAVHAGWRGALGGVVEAAVEAMVKIGAARDQIAAAVGPCIGPASYEVGLEFVEKFLAESADASLFFGMGGVAEKRLFDLPAYVLSRLERAGVDRAEWIGADTVADDATFFSNRRAVRRGEGDYGRLLSAICLV